MSIEWKDDYKIGDAEIDAQHQELFSRVNRFLLASDTTSLIKCAVSMYKYTRQHFSHEESLMRQIRYPDMPRHVEEHNRLITRLNGVAGAIALEKLDKTTWESFLTDWLIGHIAASDAKLAAYVRAQ